MWSANVFRTPFELIIFEKIIGRKPEFKDKLQLEKSQTILLEHYIFKSKVMKWNFQIFNYFMIYKLKTISSQAVSKKWVMLSFKSYSLNDLYLYSKKHGAHF